MTSINNNVVLGVDKYKPLLHSDSIVHGNIDLHAFLNDMIGNEPLESLPEMTTGACCREVMLRLMVVHH